MTTIHIAYVRALDGMLGFRGLESGSGFTDFRGQGFWGFTEFRGLGFKESRGLGVLVFRVYRD